MKNKPFKFLLILLLILFFTFNLYSQNERFTASLSQNPVTQGSSFKITFTLNTSGTNFTPPNFSKFNVLSGPSQSSSTQIINGSYSQSISFSYVLSAKIKGDIILSPATIKVKGKTVKSNRVRIKVVEPSAAEKAQRQQKAQTEKDQKNQANKIIKDNLFVLVNVNKSNVYVGEQIVATFKLFRNSQLNLRDITTDKSPKLNGFWATDLETKQNWVNETYKNVQYKSAVIKKVVLYPQQTGSLKIDPYSFNSVVRLRTQGDNRRRSSSFDDFFNRGTFKDFQHSFKSKTITINVKKLPDGQPESFSGGVGNLDAEFWFDKTETVTGEPITLKIKVSGSGNMKLMEAPKIKIPLDFEVYDPKLVDNTTTDLRGTTGNITYEYLLIPRNPGEFKINPIEFTYFNTKSKKYISSNSKEFLIKVAKGKTGATSTVISNISKEDVQYIGKDIRFIKEKKNKLSKNSTSFFGSIYYYILFLTPIILYPLFLIYWKRKDEDSKNSVLMKNRRATKVAKQRLNSAKKHLDFNKLDLFYEELAKALWGYLSDKLNIQYSELNKDRAREVLIEKNISDSDINKLMDTIDNCEFARFAPSSDNSKANNIYTNSVNLISKMEDIIK